MTATQIQQAFELMDYDNLTDAQHDLIISFEKQFKRSGRLSNRQCEILQDIFRQALAKEPKYPWEKRA